MNIFHRIKNQLLQISKRRTTRRRRKDWCSSSSLEIQLLESRALLSVVSVTTAGGNIVFQANDNSDHSVSLQRIGANTYNITGSSGTQFKLNGVSAGSSPVFTLPVVTGITVNCGLGHENYLIQDVTVSGNVQFNDNLGAATQGDATFTFQGGSYDTSVSGSITASFGNEEASFNLHASGSNLTIGGLVSVNAGNQVQDKLYTMVDSGAGKKLWLKSGLNINSAEPDSSLMLTSTGAGAKTQIDGPVSANYSGDIDIESKISGAVAINGSLSLIGGKANDTIGIRGNVHVTGSIWLSSQSAADVLEIVGTHQLNGLPSPQVDGAITFLAGGGTNIVNLQSDDPQYPIKLGSSFVFQSSGANFDEFIANNIDFLGSVSVIHGDAPVVNSPNDTFDINGSTFAGPVLLSSPSHQSVVGIANDPNASLRETVFKGALTMITTGPGSQIKVSHAGVGTPLHLKSTLTVVGGNPQTKLVKQGTVEFTPALVSLTNVIGSL